MTNLEERARTLAQRTRFAKTSLSVVLILTELQAEREAAAERAVAYYVSMPAGLRTPDLLRAAILSDHIADAGKMVAAPLQEARDKGERLAKALKISLDALIRVKDEKAPSYHDCLDDGLDKCAWCDVFDAIPLARAALAEGDNA